jgi:hypothetical protein
VSHSPNGRAVVPHRVDSSARDKWRHARRLLAILALAVFAVLLLPAGAHAGKVVDNSGRRVGWASWAKVLDRRGAMLGYLVKAGRAEYCLQTYPGRKLIAVIESRTMPVCLWDGIKHRNNKTWVGKAVLSGANWRVYKRVDGRWLRRGTVFGGRGATAVAALRLLLWDR